MFKIATLADWFGVGLIEGIRTSQLCGAEGVQVYAADEFDPRTVSRDMIAAVRNTARDRPSPPCAASWGATVLKKLRTTLTSSAI